MRHLNQLTAWLDKQGFYPNVLVGLDMVAVMVIDHDSATDLVDMISGETANLGWSIAPAIKQQVLLILWIEG